MKLLLWGEYIFSAGKSKKSDFYSGTRGFIPPPPAPPPAFRIAKRREFF